MKLLATILNTVLWLYNRVFIGYSKRLVYQPPSDRIYTAKRADEWGSQQTGSESISVARNWHKIDTRNVLVLGGGAPIGYNWDGERVGSNYTGAEVRSAPYYLNEIISDIEFECAKGSWAGFWLHENYPYREVDFELYDGKRMTCAFHWESKGRRYSYTHRIHTVKDGVFKFKLGRWTKAYINDRLVFVFPARMQKPYRVMYSMYAQGKEIETPSYMFFD